MHQGRRICPGGINVNTAGGSFSQYNQVNFDNRGTNWTHIRTRGGISADARAATPYGTVRAYVNMAPTVTDASPGTGTAIWSNRAFIQWAGFTFGNTASFFDFDPISSYSNQTNRLGSSTGGTGIPVFAYTAQFGNGFSASISAESVNGRQAAIYRNTGALNNSYAGWEWPDFVANLRVDQAWGSAQIMGAIHQLRATYYGGAGAPTTGHPGDEIGWAIGGGIKLNLPMIGHGDFLITQVGYSEGAIGYAFEGGAGIAGGNPILKYNIQNGTGSAADPITTAYGPVFDATYDTVAGSSLNLTTAWSVTAGFQHNWVPGWKTSLYGGYASFSYNSASDAMLMISPGSVGGGYPSPIAPTSGSADWSFYQIGSRTVWTPAHGLDLSVEVMYNNVNTAYNSSLNYEDKDWFSGIFRAQYSFYP